MKKTNNKYILHILHLTNEDNFYSNNYFINVHCTVCKLTLCFSIQIQKPTVNLYIYCLFNVLSFSSIKL